VIDKVAVLMREVAAQAVLPRYQRLIASEIREKAPGDLVTVADSDAERLLAARLVELIPGSAVVGEEAVYSDPSLMSHIAMDATVWLVDPVDGTGNFAGGREPFAMMVALLRAGRTEAAWILHPVSGTARPNSAAGPSSTAGRS
jgi:fructose-1,6-bisphosphatase/inositol monophosphatase family enzyme